MTKLELVWLIERYLDTSTAGLWRADKSTLLAILKAFRALAGRSG